MTRMRLGPWQLPLRTGIALVAGVIFTACCKSGPEAPFPEGCPRGTPPSTPEELRACVQRLVFDTAYEVTDEQPLAVITTSDGPRCPGDTSTNPTLSCRYGPLARIEPVVGAHRYSEEELAEGRIIARISVPATEQKGYKKYGLMPGDTTYWWVRTDATRRAGTSVFFTRGKDTRVRQDSLPLTRYLDEDPGYKDADPRSAQTQTQERKSEYKPVKLRRAIVRWIWSLKDEVAKGKCGSGSCTSP
jgi:hypothetical protein